MPSSGHSQSKARRAAEWIVPDNAAGTIYGIVTVGALLAAESGLKETYAETLGSVAITIVLYWLAHSYADVLGLRLARDERLSWRGAWQTLAHDLAIARGAGVPFLALLVAWATGASQSAAVSAGTWTAVGSLVAFELAAGLRSHGGTLELALDALVGTGMGLGIVALRALLH